MGYPNDSYGWTEPRARAYNDKCIGWLTNGDGQLHFILTRSQDNHGQDEAFGQHWVGRVVLDWLGTSDSLSGKA